ncbi:MAG: PTS sugar transporter subunit IIA [Thermoanaerobaculia bacterium]
MAIATRFAEHFHAAKESESSVNQPDRPDGRPSPESFLHLIRKSRRGRLKVYLGYAPGVGKTYRMLLEAQRLRDDCVDVVIGWVENHGRPDTLSLSLGLESVPPRVTHYRGLELEEMDLDAVIRRAPEIAIVDELAHTNATGGRNGKRWQDVLEILDAGISVLTTLNVQHLESLYDTVHALIGVTVTERVPDWVVAEADQVVNVDLATEDLRQRLGEGKVYPRERVPAALGNFFRGEALAQLRELTFREAAAHVQRAGRPEADGGVVQAPDQVMVCLSSRGPDAAALLRYGSRLAGRLNRKWLAVYVQTPEEHPGKVDPSTKEEVGNVLAVAQELGAAVFTVRGADVAGALLKFAGEYGVGHIVVGRSGAKKGLRWWLARRGVAEELVERAIGFTLVVVDPGTAATIPRPLSPPPETSLPKGEEVGSPKLGDLVSPEVVLLLRGDEDRGVVADRLVQRLTATHPELDVEMILRRVRRREEEGSTLLEELVALPHARIPGLVSPLAALAISQATEEKCRITLLLLLPEERPDASLRLLSEAARMFRGGGLPEALGRARGQREAFEIWQREAARRLS